MRWLVGFLAALALVAAGCGGTTSTTATSSDIIPASAPLFVAIDTDFDSPQWQALDSLAAKFPDKQKGVDSLKQQLKDEGLDWDVDLKHALGPELDIVMLDFAHPDEAVGLMQPADEGAFKRAVEKGNAKDPSNKLLYETFRGWTVMSDKQSAIDAFKRASDSAKETLAADETFNGAMDKTGDGVVRAYVNGPKATAAAERFAGPSGVHALSKLGTLDWLTTALKAKSDGLGWDFIVHGTPGKQLHSSSAGQSDGSLQESVPKNALLYFAFHGTKGMFDGLISPALVPPGMEHLDEILRELGRILDGENAFYVRSSGGGPYPEATFIATPPQGVDGAAILDGVLSRFAGNVGGKPRHTTIAGVPASVVGKGPLTLMYGNVKGKLVVTDVTEGLSFAQNGGDTLSQSDEFAQATNGSGAPDKRQVALYIDIHSTIPAVERLEGMHLPEGIRRNLTPLRSALEYSVLRSHELKVSVFLRIQ